MRRQATTALAAVVLAAACGGSDDPAPIQSAGPAIEAGDTAVEPTEAFTSFRYHWAQRVTAAAGMESELEVEGRFVRPDRHHLLQTRRSATSESTTELVVVGDGAWMRVGSGPFDNLENAPDVAAPGVVAASALSAGFLAEDRIFDAVVGLEPTSVVVEAGRTLARFELVAPRPAAVALLHIDRDVEVSLEGHVELDLDSGVIVGWELGATGPPSELPDGVAQRLPGDIIEASLVIRFRITGIDDPSVEVGPPETG